GVILGQLGRKAEADAVLLELHGHGSRIRAALNHRNRELAPGQKAGFFSVGGDQIRFRENLQNTLGLQGADAAPVVVRAMVLAAPVETRFTANWLLTFRSSEANRTRRTICLSTGCTSTCRLLTICLANGAARAMARSATSLDGT